MLAYTGYLEKMRVTLTEQRNAQGAQSVDYSLQLGEAIVPLNSLIGTSIRLEFSTAIACTHCGRKTKKSFSQGYCYPCFQSLAQCDRCIMSPELCHFDQGTCREPDWGQSFCMTDHVVYLANSSGLKVGITRASQIPTRWIDQGAVAAIPFARVATRQQAGLLETALKQHVADKTNWRTMLKGEQAPIDLVLGRQELAQAVAEELTQLQDRFGLQALQLVDSPVVSITYPVQQYPEKITSLNADKNPDVVGLLQGIKGQYLVLDTGVINLRKYTGYEVTLHTGGETA
ncbi:DUF2797 domain-containing protein [Simiduia curdlanivorans]|uniref:DUF2797 domain-containing protein n=1 Tax=Simiduia curdlanivorans TaxID=1492769 RepID=A0ABV8VAP2_9GAMM|nr:DUF2797 domain-containing protein [Simiduia curdlanivorans]MDN3639530.1 DUF2797 domain-containing protein [Simiduia curdlanivorans]